MNEARAPRPPILEPEGIFALICAAPFLSFLAKNLYEGLRLSDLRGYWAVLGGGIFALYLVGAGVFHARTLRLVSGIAVTWPVFLSYNDACPFFEQAGFEAMGQRVGGFGWLAMALVVAVRWGREQVRETLGILNALHLPRECQRGLHFGLTPDNDMRIVFACRGGHDPRLLRERHFVVRGGPLDGGKIRRVTLD